MVTHAPRRLAALHLVALFLCFPAAQPAHAQDGGEETLTNQSVISMVVGKLNKDLILAKITNTRNEFDVTASGIVNLHQSKVSQDVIRAMMSSSADPKLGRSGGSGEVLSNQGVIAMTTATVPRPLVLAKIGNTPNEFDVTVTALVNLHQSKVHLEVLNAMIGASVDTQLGRAANASEVLANQSVVALVTAGVPKQIILLKIQNTKVDFDVSANGMVALNQSKVPQDVIKAMVVRASAGG